MNENRRNHIVTEIWMLMTASIPFLQGGYFYVVPIGLSLLYMCLYMYVGPRKTFVPGYMRLYLVLFFGAVTTLVVAIDRGMHLIYIMKLTLPISLWLSTEGVIALVGRQSIMKAIRKILLIWSIGLTLPFIVGALLSMDFFIQHNRYGGFFQYANSYGAFLCGILVVWILPLPTFVMPKGKVRHIAVILLIVAIALTQSRGIYAITIVIILMHGIVNRKSLGALSMGIFLGWLVLIVIGVDDVARGTDVSNNNSEWLSRIVYYMDGLKMFRDHPLGIGHLGFYYLQGMYQTAALYHVRFIHQSLLQILLDVGVLGLISWTGMLVYPLWKGLKTHWKLPFVCGMSLVFFHTFIDFDMQFSAMWVLWYLAMLMMTDCEEVEHVLIKKIGWMRRMSFGIGAVILAYFTLVTGLEYTGSDQLALELYPGYTKAASRILKEQTVHEISYEKKQSIAQELTERKPYFYDGFAFLRKYYYNNGDLKKSIDNAQKVVELKPLHMHNLETYMVHMLEYLLNGEAKNTISSDHPYFKEILGMQAYLNRLKERKDYRFSIQHEVTVEWTPRMQRIVTITQNLYDRIELE